VTPGFAEDLAAAALSLARRFADGATMWCCAPAWPSHARHVAVEFVHPVIVGKRALPAVAVAADMPAVETLRASLRAGDVVLAIGHAEDPEVADVMRRCPAWGAETIWLGAGHPPEAGAADHVLWIDTDIATPLSSDVVRAYHLLWELTHVCFERPGALRVTAPATGSQTGSCPTCADEGTLAEVESVDGDRAVVRTPDGRRLIDTSLIPAPSVGDLVLVHAGTVIATYEGAAK
jgi:hypothetical protein